MKAQLTEYLNAYFQRWHERAQRHWQRTRRIGRSRYIIRGMALFWLAQLILLAFATWRRHLPHHYWYEYLAGFVFVLSLSVGQYYSFAYVWRVNERLFGNCGSASSSATSPKNPDTLR